MNLIWRAAVLLILWCGVVCATTTISVSDTAVNSPAKRIGVNLGSNNYYDSGEMVKPLLFRNPGFEGQLYQSMIRCETGAATGCTDDDVYAIWYDGFWDGATYEVIWGSAKGRTGTIAHFTQHSGGAGNHFEFGDSGAAPGTGDWMIVRKEFWGDGGQGEGAAWQGWWPSTNGATPGATITTESADLPPDTIGRQAVKLTALQPGQRAELAAFFGAYANQPFLIFNGNYRLSFKAKGAGGSNRLQVMLQRDNTFLFNQTLNLSGSWNNYTIDFTGTENASPLGGLALKFIPLLSGALVDDVSLTQLDTDADNPTFFRDPVVNAIEGLHPGILRDWSFRLGNSLDNELAQPLARLRAGYSNISTVRGDLQYGLHEFLELCELAQTEPWYSFPITFSPQEITNLMEYLGGPVTTPYGARRAALGHPTPWTDVFNRIHLEFGNESWNFVFAGGSIGYALPYGNRGSELFGIAKSSPYYSHSKFNFILGGQATYVGRNQVIHNASTNHDSMSLAPYLGYEINNFANNEELFGPLFAEPEQINDFTYMRDNCNMLQSSGMPVPISIYETNLHSTTGSISQTALDSFTPSVGAGIAVADHLLMMMRDLHANDVNLFSLPGYRYNRMDGKTVLLWGVARDMGVTDRKRPQYLAVQLANEAILGDMVQAPQSGENPVWNQPLLNRVQLNNAHFLQSYAFSAGCEKSLIVFNLSRTNGYQMDFSGANAPSGSVTLRRLTSASINDNNESSETVLPVTQSLNDFDPAQPLNLPAFSMNTLRWRISVPASPGDSLRLTKSGTIDLSWNAAPGAVQYFVKRCDASTGPCVPGMLSMVSQTTYSDASAPDISWYNLDAENSCGSTP